MKDPYLIEDSWENGVKDRKRQNENNVSAMLETFVAVAETIERPTDMTGARKIKEQS